MKKHFSNPIPEDLHNDKVDYYPFNYDIDKKEPEKHDENKRVTDETYRTSKAGTNLLKAEPMDIQGIHDLSFVGMDNEWQNEANKFQYSTNGRKKELEFPHISIYDKKGGIKLRDDISIRFFNCMFDYIKAGTHNTLNLSNSIFNPYYPGERVISDGINCTINLVDSGCDTYWTIKNMKKSRITIDFKDGGKAILVKKLLITKNENCNFVLRNCNFSRGWKDPILLGENTNCSFRMESCLNSDAYVTKNEKCRIWERGTTFAGSERPYGDNIGCNVHWEGCVICPSLDFVIKTDFDGTYLFEGLTGKSTHGMIIVNSDIQFIGCSVALGNAAIRFSDCTFGVADSFIQGNTFMALEKVYGMWLDSTLQGMTYVLSDSKKCDIFSHGSTLDGLNDMCISSKEMTFRLDESTIKSINKMFEIKDSAVFTNKSTLDSKKKNIEGDNNRVMIGYGSTFKAIKENITGENYQFLKVMKSDIKSDTKNNIEIKVIQDVEIQESTMKTIETNLILDKCKTFDVGRSVFNTPKVCLDVKSDAGSIAICNIYESEFPKPVTLELFNDQKDTANAYKDILTIKDSQLNMRKGDFLKELTLTNCIADISETKVTKDITISGKGTINTLKGNQNISIDGDFRISELKTPKNLTLKGSNTLLKVEVKDCSSEGCVQIESLKANNFSQNGNLMAFNINASNISSNGVCSVNNIAGNTTSNGVSILNNASNCNLIGSVLVNNSTVTSAVGAGGCSNCGGERVDGMFVAASCSFKPTTSAYSLCGAPSCTMDFMVVLVNHPEEKDKHKYNIPVYSKF